MSELKPCPFCGSDEIDVMPDRLLADGADPPVFCDGCHASAMDAESWNRRAPLPTVTREELARALVDLSFDTPLEGILALLREKGVVG